MTRKVISKFMLREKNVKHMYNRRQDMKQTKKTNYHTCEISLVVITYYCKYKSNK